MANSKVSDLTAASALDGTELYYGVQGSADRKVTGAQIRTLAGDIRTATTTISSAQILALFATPVTLIAAPGAGFAIDVMEYLYEFKFNTVAYTLGANRFVINYEGSGSNDNPSIDGRTIGEVLLSAASTLARGVGNQLANATAVTPMLLNRTAVENKPIVTVGSAGNPTLGDGVLYVTLRYRIYTFQG